MLTEKDIQAIEKKGRSLRDVENQLKHFKTGFPFIRLAKPATVGDGMHEFNDSEIALHAKYFDTHHNDYDIVKFVPASGAASRMFKNLLKLQEEMSGKPFDRTMLGSDKDFDSPAYFFSHIRHFAFFEELKSVLNENGYDLGQLTSENQYNIILDYFLSSRGLNYANLPKGLLSFHDYPDGPRTAFEEHLVEGVQYSTGKDGVTSIHLTVSPEHQSKFEALLSSRRSAFEQKFGVVLSVSFSQQKPSTDTIAVDMNNEPFRETGGSLLFRPGGHGALIENLNDLKKEIIFIKNIDNVVPDRLKEKTFVYKKAIGGLLMQLQERSFQYLEMLNEGNLSEHEIVEIREFAEGELNIPFTSAFETYDQMEKIDYLFNFLNRPMRICGMVRNEGEPGGGPFWVLDSNEELSLQIVESSQIDMDDPGQKEIVNRSTHFNPVDLVCGIFDFKGEPFDLHQFVDPETGFISVKSKDGRELKAQELPGLWNGAMADWITVFVEVPLITFNPVKTINDLLRKQHQPEGQ
ncbi:MAG: DUF4301 family protein [bacterium]